MTAIVTVHIKFSKSQIKILEPLFKAVRTSGGIDAILGQCFYDGMAARVIPNEKVLAIQKVTIGQTTNRTVYSSNQQMYPGGK